MLSGMAKKKLYIYIYMCVCVCVCCKEKYTGANEWQKLGMRGLAFS